MKTRIIDFDLDKAKCFLTDKVVRKYSKACERWTKGRDISKMISDNGKR